MAGGEGREGEKEQEEVQEGIHIPRPQPTMTAACRSGWMSGSAKWLSMALFAYHIVVQFESKAVGQTHEVIPRL